MYALTEGRQELPEQLARLVDERTAGLSGELEKISALYDMLQERTRYVSVQLDLGGWQPFPADYVEKNNYGDCKALSNYMAAMLTHVGIASNHVVVTRSEEYFPAKADFTAPNFNHMILYVPSQDMFLECTNYMPPGYTPEDIHDRNVLLVTSEGGKLVRTPKSEVADNGQLRTVEIAVHDDGSADYNLNIRAHGFEHESYRFLEHYERERIEQLKWMHRRDILPDVTGSHYSLEVRKDEPVAEINYSTKVNGYARTMGKRMFLPINKFGEKTDAPGRDTARINPIALDDMYFNVDTIKLTLPPGMEVESLGDPEVLLSHQAGEYRATVAVVDNQITWVRTLKMEPVELPPTEYESYRTFMLAIGKAERRQVVLRDRRTK